MNTTNETNETNEVKIYTARLLYPYGTREAVEIVAATEAEVRMIIERCVGSKVTIESITEGK
jgi:hypothetical protein